VSYTAAEGRAQLLSELEGATDQIATALAVWGEAYEWLDDQTADRLEAELFRPVQAAYARARRTYAEFAGRYDLDVREVAPTPMLSRPGDARAAIEHGAQALQEADGILATLQDSMLPIEVGDPALRAGLSHVREGIGRLPSHARQLLRLLGR
jgi:hypothetical protein